VRRSIRNISPWKIITSADKFPEEMALGNKRKFNGAPHNHRLTCGSISLK
jgi:hypothetical protein